MTNEEENAKKKSKLKQKENLDKKTHKNLY